MNYKNTAFYSFIFAFTLFALSSIPRFLYGADGEIAAGILGIIGTVALITGILAVFRYAEQRRHWRR